MQLLRTSRLAAVFTLTLTAGPLTAQAYHWDLGVNGGYQTSTKALTAAQILTNAVTIVTPTAAIVTTAVVTSTSDLRYKPSGIFGGQIGYWFTHNFGIRANGAYAPSGFKQHSGATLIDRVKLWGLTGDLMYHFIQPRARFSGVEWLPFAALGAGAQWVNPNHRITGVFIPSDTTTVTAFTGSSGTPIVCANGVCTGPSTPGFILGRATALDTTTFFMKKQARFTGLAGVGTDVRVAKAFAFRLEVGDRIWQAPIYRALQRTAITNAVFVRERVGKTVHEFYFTAGAHVLFGLEAPPPEPVAVQPAPPPPPPATEGISVCVVDPSVNGGIRTINAVRDLTTGDTLVTVNGQSVPLSTTVPNVPVASTADWFVSGRPLQIGTTADKLQFVTTGGARVVNPSDLALLGTVNGLPVYVDRNTLTPIDGLTPGTDLSFTVDNRPQVRRQIEQKVQVVYVPLQPTGCIFQPMQALEKVRKTR